MTIKYLAYGILIVLLSSCSAEMAATGEFDGWSQVAVPDTRTFQCSNAAAEWRVMLERGKVMVTPNNGRDDDPLPFHVAPLQSANGVDFSGRRRVIPVEDGYLVGYDAGEFGGGLWWFSKDGSIQRRLSHQDDHRERWLSENVHEIVETASGYLVAQGLAHLGSDSGRLSLVGRDADNEWEVSELAELPSSPYAMIREGASTVLVAMSGGLARVGVSGVVTAIYLEPRLGPLYPNSLVQTREGLIYMGMRNFVLVLSPNSGSYDVTYWTKERCQAGSCICGGNN